MKIEAIIEEADENDAQADGAGLANKIDPQAPEPGGDATKPASKAEAPDLQVKNNDPTDMAALPNADNPEPSPAKPEDAKAEAAKQPDYALPMD